MGQKTAYKKIISQEPAETILEQIETEMRRLGGALQRSGDSITIHNGATGVNMAFMAELQATITLKRKSNDEYEIYCDILYKPNGLFWACLVVGFFCLWFLWILNFLYLMVDPLPAYQSILDRIPNKI